MHNYTTTSKLLQPRRTGVSVKLGVIAHVITDILKWIAVVGALSGIFLLIYGGIYLNWKILLYGALTFTSSMILIGVPLYILLDLLQPNTPYLQDVQILRNKLFHKRTQIIKETDLTEVKHVTEIDKKTSLITVKPLRVGNYVDWTLTLSNEVADILKPGYFIRHRIIRYRFNDWGENTYFVSKKLMIYDQNENLIMVLHQDSPKTQLKIVKKV